MKLYAYKFDGKLHLSTVQYDMKASKKTKTESIQVERIKEYEEANGWSGGTHIERETYMDDVEQTTTWYLPPKPTGSHFDIEGNSSQVGEIGSFNVSEAAEPLVELILGSKQTPKASYNFILESHKETRSVIDLLFKIGLEQNTIENRLTPLLKSHHLNANEYVALTRLEVNNQFEKNALAMLIDGTKSQRREYAARPENQRTLKALIEKVKKEFSPAFAESFLSDILVTQNISWVTLSKTGKETIFKKDTPTRKAGCLIRSANSPSGMMQNSNVTSSQNIAILFRTSS